MKTADHAIQKLYFNPNKDRLVQQDTDSVYPSTELVFRDSWLKLLATEVFIWLLIYIGVIGFFQLMRFLSSSLER